MAGVEEWVFREGIARLRPQSPRKREECGVVMAWWVGWGVVAVSEVRWRPEVRSGWIGSGRGREKRREDWRRRAVGELAAFDIGAERGGSNGSGE